MSKSRERSFSALAKRQFGPKSQFEGDAKTRIAATLDELQMQSAETDIFAASNAVLLRCLERLPSLVENVPRVASPIRRIAFDRNGDRRFVFGAAPHCDAALNAARARLSTDARAIAAMAREGRFALFDGFAARVDAALGAALRLCPSIAGAKLWGDYRELITQTWEGFRRERMRDLRALRRDLADLRVRDRAFPTLPLDARRFRPIDEYVSASPGESAAALLRSDLRGCCAVGCACANAELAERYAEYAPSLAQFRSNCPDKARGVECGAECACGPRCRNQPLQRGEQLRLGREVALQPCWGVDLFTRKNLFLLLPTFVSFRERSDLLDALLCALNEGGDNGWELSAAIERAALKVGPRAAAALRVLGEHARTAQTRALLRVHSKGLGLVCRSPTGIPQNALIVRYLGEIYPFWLWHAKQSAMRSLLARRRRRAGADFYNILLEKSVTEPNGRALLIVDPILNGNFASRLSHSCDPNCCALPTIANGQYNIALFSTRAISPGEELTFNYFSSTESSREFRAAICLCGQLFCFGHYLADARRHQTALGRAARRQLIDGGRNAFLRANALLLRAGLGVLGEAERARLAALAFGANLFGDAPNWVRCWAALAIAEAENERERLRLAGAASDALFAQRITAIATAVERARHFLAKQPRKFRECPPLQYASLTAQIASARSALSAAMNARPKIQTNDLPANFGEGANEEARELLSLKYALLAASHELRESAPGLSDALYLRSFTIVHFFPTPFQSFECAAVVRECDIDGGATREADSESELARLARPIAAAPRRVPPTRLWAELVYWSRPAFDRPEAALAVARRGTLLAPDVAKEPIGRRHPTGDRRAWLRRMATRPAEPWRAGRGWSFAARGELYGSPLFDDFVLGREQRAQLLAAVDAPWEEKRALFVAVWRAAWQTNKV